MVPITKETQVIMTLESAINKTQGLIVNSHLGDYNSIAKHATAWQHAMLTHTNNSIAALVATCCCVTVHTIIDMEMGQALKYHQLLHHRNFKTAWQTSAFNEFCHLAQDIGGKINGTNTIDDQRRYHI